jgi:hypothetical protein
METQQNNRSRLLLYRQASQQKLQMGLNPIFSHFADICTRVAVFSKEITMPVHKTSDVGTNFSPLA